jgi:hypothetical protein
VRSSPVRPKRGDRSAHPTDRDDTSAEPVRATVLQARLAPCPTACGRRFSAAPSKRTVASALRAVGLENERRFCRYHRVLSRAVWSSREVSRVLLVLLVETFVHVSAWALRHSGIGRSRPSSEPPQHCWGCFRWSRCLLTSTWRRTLIVPGKRLGSTNPIPPSPTLWRRCAGSYGRRNRRLFAGHRGRSTR